MKNDLYRIMIWHGGYLVSMGRAVAENPRVDGSNPPLGTTEILNISLNATPLYAFKLI